MSGAAGQQHRGAAAGGFGLPDHATVAVRDLMRDATFTWTGKYQRVRLDPAGLPFAIWQIALPGTLP